MKRWTRDEDLQFVRLWQAGTTTRSMAALFGCSHLTISNRARFFRKKGVRLIQRKPCSDVEPVAVDALNSALGVVFIVACLIVGGMNPL